MIYSFLLCSLLVAAQDDSKLPQVKQTTELAERFYAAWENGNVEGLLTYSTLPFYLDGQAVIEQQDVLQLELKKLNDKREKAHGKRTADVKLVASYGMMKERMPAKDRAMLEKVVRDDDYLALVMLKPTDVNNRKSENVVLLARIKDGKATVIGIKHTQ